MKAKEIANVFLTVIWSTTEVTFLVTKFVGPRHQRFPICNRCSHYSKMLNPKIIIDQRERSQKISMGCIQLTNFRFSR